MKIIATLIFLLAISPAHAEIYKCVENGKTSYQQTQCKQSGTEFKLQGDISLEQQEEAVKKLTADLEARAEEKRLQKQAEDKERQLRAQEESVNASYENARSSRQQAAETSKLADTIRNRRYRTPYPHRPIATPLETDSATSKPLP